MGARLVRLHFHRSQTGRKWIPRRGRSELFLSAEQLQLLLRLQGFGEEVLEGAENCFIWRLRIPFNHVDGARNYISKMMRYDRLLVATNSLSHLDEFADCCVQSWIQRIPFGTYNLTNPGSVTTRDVIRLIQKHGLSNKSFQFFDSEDQFLQIAAKTPRSNCVLDSGKAVAAGLPLSPIEEALDKAMKAFSFGS